MRRTPGPGDREGVLMGFWSLSVTFLRHLGVGGDCGQEGLLRVLGRDPCPEERRSILLYLGPAAGYAPANTLAPLTRPPMQSNLIRPRSPAGPGPRGVDPTWPVVRVHLTCS